MDKWGMSCRWRGDGFVKAIGGGGGEEQEWTMGQREEWRKMRRWRSGERETAREEDGRRL